MCIRDRSQEDYERVKMQGERKAREDRVSAAERVYDGPPQVYPSKVNPRYHQSSWIADQAIELIQSTPSEQPFFLMCSFVDPHHPFDPPESYMKKYDPEKLSSPFYKEGELEDKPPQFSMHRTGHGYGNEKYDYRKLTDLQWREIKSAYYGMITLIDENIGRILDVLEQNKMSEDTLILFTNDHGELLGDHGLLFKGPFMYDCLIKAPMIIRWPGVIPSGSRYRQITEHVDIMPTILDLAGVPIPRGVQGTSMATIVRGDEGVGHEYALTEFSCYDWGLMCKTLTGKRYKLTYYAGEDFGELYDRKNDPNETQNLWEDPEYTLIKEQLMHKLLDRLIQTEDPLPLRIGKY